MLGFAIAMVVVAVLYSMRGRSSNVVDGPRRRIGFYPASGELPVERQLVDSAVRNRGLIEGLVNSG